MVPWAHAQYREVRVSRRDVGVEMQIDFTPVDVDTGAIKFRDRHREKQRQRRLKRDQEAMEVCRPGRTCSTDGVVTCSALASLQAKAAARRVQAEKRRRQAAKPEPVRSAHAGVVDATAYLSVCLRHSDSQAEAQEQARGDHG